MFQGARIRDIESGLRGVIQSVDAKTISIAWTRPDNPFMKEEETVESSSPRAMSLEVFTSAVGWHSFQHALDPEAYERHVEYREYLERERPVRLPLVGTRVMLEFVNKRNPFRTWYNPSGRRDHVGAAIRGVRRPRTGNEECKKEGGKMICTHTKDKYKRGPKKGQYKQRVIAPWDGKDSYNKEYVDHARERRQKERPKK